MLRDFEKQKHIHQIYEHHYVLSVKNWPFKVCVSGSWYICQSFGLKREELKASIDRNREAQARSVEQLTATERLWL